VSAERSLGNQVGQTDPELNPGSNLGPNPGLGAVPNSERNHAHLQRRTLGVLSAANALGAIGMTIGVATASLLAKEVSGRESLAGLAQTFQTIGAAGAAYFLAQVADRRGRRIGLSLGFLIGAAGSALMVLAAGLGSMTLLLMGALMLGSVSATGLAARYAATDLATAETRARSLAIVVWMTTIGAVLGPNLSSWSQRLGPILGVPELAGSFALGALAMLAGAAVAWLWLRPDPLLVARAAETHAVAPWPGARESAWVKALRAARADYRLAAAILALGAAHAVMVSVMIMTPLHMEHGQATLRIIGLVISVHIVGMFLFAPLVGWACDRWGRSSILGLGGGVLLLSLAIAGT
jgi:MFS family permease